MPPESFGRLLHHLTQPTNNPTQPLVTQMQPPMLPPPPHPNFQSVDLYTQLPVTSAPLLISKSEPPATSRQTPLVTSEVLHTLQYLLTESTFHSTLKSSHTEFQHQVRDKLLMDSDSQGSNIQAGSTVGQVTETVTETSTSQPPSKLPGGEPFFKVDSHTQNPLTQTEIRQSGSVPQLLSQTQYHQLVTESQSYQSYRTSTQVAQSELKDPAQPQHPELSTLHPQVPVSPHVNMSIWVNATQQGNSVKSAKSSNDSELTDWLKRNTSQSPMTSNDPR